MRVSSRASSGQRSPDFLVTGSGRSSVCRARGTAAYPGQAEVPVVFNGGSRSARSFPRGISWLRHRSCHLVRGLPYEAHVRTRACPRWGSAERPSQSRHAGPSSTKFSRGLVQSCTKWYSSDVRRVFQTRTFNRWMRKTGLPEDALCDAVSEMTRGLVDADLGGGVIKKRIALPGQGKRGECDHLI